MSGISRVRARAPESFSHNLPNNLWGAFTLAIERGTYPFVVKQNERSVNFVCYSVHSRVNGKLKQATPFFFYPSAASKLNRPISVRDVSDGKMIVFCDLVA